MKWPVVALRDALASADVFVDGDWVESKDQDPDGDVRLVQLADVGDGEYFDKSNRFLTSAKARELRCTFLEPGDVLVARMPDPLGRACIFPGDARPSVTVVDVCIIRPDPQMLDARWLMHCLNGPNCRNQIAGYATGTTRSRISRGNLGKVRIPLPPLPEQRRIAAILDKADALRAKRRAAVAQLDTLTQSIFLDVFAQELRGPAIDTRPNDSNCPKGCSWALLTEVARLATGHTPDRGRADYWHGDIPWISLSDIRSLDGNIAMSTAESTTPAGIENSSAVLLPKDTVCFSRTASVGYVTVMGREMATSQDFMNWVCGPKLDPIYLMWALIHSRQRLVALAPGSTHRTIYMRVVEQFHVLLPPIEAQRRFAKRVERISDLRRRMQASLRELDGLFASLQHRAFHGELSSSAHSSVQEDQNESLTTC